MKPFAPYASTIILCGIFNIEHINENLMVWMCMRVWDRVCVSDPNQSKTIEIILFLLVFFQWTKKIYVCMKNVRSPPVAKQKTENGSFLFRIDFHSVNKFCVYICMEAYPWYTCMCYDIIWLSRMQFLYEKIELERSTNGRKSAFEKHVVDYGYIV